MEKPCVAVFGAAGLIGAAVVRDLRRRGYPVVAVARRFGPADRGAPARARIEAPFAEMSADELRKTLAEHGVEVVVNCVGVLQSGASGRAETAHVEFPMRLVEAMRALDGASLIVHVSIPGAEFGETAFSRTKRRAEIAIEELGLPYVQLRPGFVISAGAYGGGALVRALAAWPFRLPRAESDRPFRIVAMTDVTATVAWAAAAWGNGRRDFALDFDVMSASPTTVGDVVAGFRRHFGGPRPWAALPPALLGLGARLADAVAALGWSAPVRSTALKELRRGVSGDPSVWMRETGLTPKTLNEALDEIAPSVQERWFARLYLLKAAVIATLAAFFALSGLIAVTAGFGSAKAALTARGFSPPAATGFVALTGGLDLVVAALIATRRSSRLGLLAALALAGAYLVGGSLLAPELWADPLGPFVKVFPVMALTAAALAVCDDR